MSWFLLLGIFWKPLYYFVRYLWAKFKTKDDTHSFWLEQVSAWGLKLLELVKP